MRRADRLFDIIQILRRRKLVRARDLAEKLEVSERTIYRDIRDLAAGGVSIEGEAGVGYILREGYDLPPIMFNEQEIEALVLGVRIVESWADPELAEAAGNVIAKVEAVVPERLRRHMDETALLAPEDHYAETTEVDVGVLRGALRPQGPDHRAQRAAAGAVVLWPDLAALGLVRAAPGLSLLPARPHHRPEGPGRDLPAGARQDPAGPLAAGRQVR
jgi:biotin operon repressor